MALEKYVRESAGQLEEKEPVQTGGTGKEDQLIATDASGLLDPSFLPPGSEIDVATIEASETLAAGDFVNIHDSGGVKVRKADASDPIKQADGFILAGVTSGADAFVYLEGRNTAKTGLTIGAVQYLSTTPGATTETAPSGSGNIVQVIGKAYSTTIMTTENLSGITLKKA